MKTDVIQKTIVINSDGKILLLRRSDTDDRRPLQWDFPGGLLDEGEALEDGAKREILEETGLSVSDVIVFYSKTEVMKWSKDNVDHEANAVRIYYQARAEKSEVKLSYEHSEFAWVTLQEAVEMLEYHRHKAVVQYVLDNNLLLQA